MAEPDKIVKFFHGASSGISAKIEDGTINESDLVITSDTDELIYIDETKTQKPLGSSKSKNEYTVELGSGGTVGGLKTGDTITAGTTLDDLIKLLTQKSVPATYTQPGVTCRVSSGTAAGQYEVGTLINTTIQGLFTQNDAGALTTLEVFKSGVDQALISGSTSPQTTEQQSFTLGEETVTFTAKATYAEGAIKNDNLGQPSPDGHITAGSKTSSGVSFIGKRNLFYGAGVGELPELVSSAIRGLSGTKLAPANGTTFTVNVSQGQQYVIIAYPASLRNMTKCFYVEQNTDLVGNFNQTTISVEGANGAAGAEYKVYSYEMAVPAAAGMTLNVTI